MKVAFLILILNFLPSYKATPSLDREFEIEEYSLSNIRYDFEALKNPEILGAIDFTDMNSVTESNTGCACWFDPNELFTNAGDCACCKSNGTQCGYPMHEYCQPSVSTGEELTGCQGKLLSEFLHSKLSLS